MVDITKPSSPVELTVSGSAATVPGKGPRTILAFGADQVQAPDSLTLHQPVRLTPLVGHVDTIVITTADLMNAVQPLIDLRQSQNLQVKMVDIQQVYDAFSFGEKDPQAIRNFLSATQRGKQPPHYVLLVGDASNDPRNFLGLSFVNGVPDLVPTKLIPTDFSLAASDQWFADFKNKGLSTMAIGRLPAESPDDVSKIVAKIIAYESSPPGNGFVLASDDEKGFEDDSNSLLSLLPAGVMPTSIRRAGDFSNRQELLKDINAGPDLVNYIGHGNVDTWAGGQNWFSGSDTANLTNTTHPAFFVLMTCLNGYFVDPQVDSIAESMLRADGGAVAVWASSGVTVPSGQVLANKKLYGLLFGATPAPPLGEAVRQAKNFSDDLDVRQTWNLLGDPETRLRR
jgi:hypothetical protein